MDAARDDLIAEGQAALRAGDAATARRAFEEACSQPAQAAVLEGLARVAYIEQDYQQALAGWERAYAAHREEGDHASAVRVARALAYLYLSIVGDHAVGGGWLSRAKTLLGEASNERVGSSEFGWVALDIGMFEGDRDRKEGHFREALEIARQHADPDLEFATLAYLGASLVHGDRGEEGMILLDEALAAVAGGEVEDFCVLEEIFCQLFSACEHAHDVTRADQWIRVGEAIAERRKLPAVSAFCRTHYGGILTAAGRWTEADAALTEAARLWGLGHKALRGGALIRLADLRVRQGRFEEAEELLDGLDPLSDPDVARPLAAIHLWRGDTGLARDLLEGALEQVEPLSTRAAPLLALLVDVHLSAGDVDAATTVADRLTTCAARHQGHYLHAVAALARGRVSLAAGDGDTHAHLREALSGFARAEMPMEVARSRLELASALVNDRPEVAMAEARAALEAFERLRAARHADAAAALLRSLGVRPAAAKSSGAVLTKRESEVLELVARGLSNPEISERLYISRKTVEHHVGNILSKLGLRTRAQATAYLTRSKNAASIQARAKPAPE